jgi:hypothetical protein
MQELLVDLPCPHWLIRSRRRAEWIAPPFAIFGLEGVLYFLLLCIEVERRSAPGRAGVQLSSDAQFVHLHLRLKQLTWRFRLPRHSDGAPSLRVDFLHSRGGSTRSYQAEGLASDAALIEALAGWAKIAVMPHASTARTAIDLSVADAMAYPINSPGTPFSQKNYL